MFSNLPSLFPTLSTTFTARLTASFFFLLFCWTLRNFSYDHFEKNTYQMHAFLIQQNTLKIPQYEDASVYYYNNHDDAGGEFYEFEDDGEEDYEQYNDEDYHITY